MKIDRSTGFGPAVDVTVATLNAEIAKLRARVDELERGILGHRTGLGVHDEDDEALWALVREQP